MSVQALKSTFSIILKCSVRAIGQNNLIIPSSRLYNLADINIKIPTNSERAFLIAGRIVGTNKIRLHSWRFDTQIRKGFGIVTSCDMHTITHFPTFTVKGIVRFIIRSPPRTKPVIFSSKIIYEVNTAIKIECSFCIQRTIFIIDICFAVVPKDCLLATFITKMNDL